MLEFILWIMLFIILWKVLSILSNVEKKTKDK